MKRGLKIFLFTDAWATLALGMIGPIYAIFVEKIGGNILDASWAYFAFMVTTGIMIYLVSRWEDRVKHKEKLITVGYVLTSIGCLSYIFVDSQASLIVTQIILGVAEAVLLPISESFYSEYLDKKHQASDWGTWEAMYYIIMAVAALIGGFVAITYGFKILFIIMFIISLFSILSSLGLYRKKKYLNKK